MKIHELPRPTKIIAVGRNYAEHAKELGNEPPAEPIIFLKPPSAVLKPGGTIVRPPISERVDYEGELAIVIGREAKNVRASQWREVVRGFTCANDVTARDLQKKDVQFTRAKSFDTFCPLGPHIEKCDFLIEFITQVMTLFPGDVILTGTPAGVGPLNAGDVVEVEIEGIGILRNGVS